MLYPGRIPLNAAENAAVNELLAEHDGNAGLTRRDPNDTRPVLVHIGDQVFEVDGDGNVEDAS